MRIPRRLAALLVVLAIGAVSCGAGSAGDSITEPARRARTTVANLNDRLSRLDDRAGSENPAD
jgi:hypothetical protein